MRIALLMAALNDLNVKVGDVLNAYITAPITEKVWTVLGPEFGCEDSYTESLCCDSAFAHKKKFYIFEFPKRFLEIS